MPIIVFLLIRSRPVGVVQLGGLAADILPNDFMMPGMTAHAVFILKLLSSMIGLWLWGLAIWCVESWIPRATPYVPVLLTSARHTGSSSSPWGPFGSMPDQNTRARPASR